MSHTIGGTASVTLVPANSFFIGVPYYGISPSETYRRSSLVAVGDIRWNVTPPENPDFVLVPRDYLIFNGDGTVSAAYDAYVAYRNIGDTVWTPRDHTHVEYLYCRVTNEAVEAENGNFSSLIIAEVVTGSAVTPGDEIAVAPQAVFFEKPGYIFARIVKDRSVYIDPLVALATNYIADAV